VVVQFWSKGSHEAGLGRQSIGFSVMPLMESTPLQISVEGQPTAPKQNLAHLFEPDSVAQIIPLPH
jgi:hypothetical protein